MSIKKWIPWNWFKKEEEDDRKAVPIQRAPVPEASGEPSCWTAISAQLIIPSKSKCSTLVATKHPIEDGQPHTKPVIRDFTGFHSLPF